jgi:hypothetical protein
MANFAFAQRARRRLLAIVVFVGVGLLIVPAGGVLGQQQPEADHLKCFSVTKDELERLKIRVDLFTPQFRDEEGCVAITPAVLFCAPSEKFSETSPEGDDPRGGALETDFLCYRVFCRPPAQLTAMVDDQFAQRSIELGRTRLLCTPAVKIQQ